MTESSAPTTAGAAEAGGGGATAKKKGGRSRMLKIRGFLTGKSRREKRKEREAAKQAERGAARPPATEGDGRDGGDDQSTVYGVDVDDGSVGTPNRASMAATSSSLLKKDEDEEEADLFNEDAAADKMYLLKVVLLLMDAKTRRFELLQLEFDSIKASVEDVLSQIPVAVTEEVLQEQTYHGITCSDGRERFEGQVLADFCKGGDVMVGIAEGMTAAECIKLALPILSDPKVISMLKACGIDAAPWAEVKKTVRGMKEAKRSGEKKVSTNKYPGTSPASTRPESAPKSLAKTTEGELKATKGNGPRSKGNGEAGSAAASSKNTSAATDKDKEVGGPVITFHPNEGEPHTIEHTTVTHNRGVKITARGSSSPSTTTPFRKPGAADTPSMKRFFMIVVALGILSAVIVIVDFYLKAPIRAGQVLPPGTVLHRCGVAGAIPGLQSVLSTISSKFDCDDISVIVEKERVTAYDKDGNPAWVILGTHYSNTKYCDVDKTEDCAEGLHFLDSKHILVSGTKITWVETFANNVNLHPWPFEDKPISRTWRK